MWAGCAVTAISQPTVYATAGRVITITAVRVRGKRPRHPFNNNNVPWK